MHRRFAALIALCLSVPAAAQEPAKTPPPGAAAMQFSFAPIVKRVTPAVVNVYAQRIERESRNPLFDDPFFQQFFGGEGGAPRERVQQSLGSGVIVTADGLVVTNFHVISEATQIKVALADRREFAADVVLRDQQADLAVLRLKEVKDALPTLAIAPPDSIEVGDLVLAVGDPFGVGQTVTSGIVSALARSQAASSDFQTFIQTDAPINPGNSGGALVDMAGRLVGINTAIVSRSGGNIGIGFAIPAAMVQVVIESAKAGSPRVQRPWLGATLQSVTADLADSLRLDRPGGALVTDVAGVGPAKDAGFKAGDVILAIEGIAVDDAAGFSARFATRPLGGSARVDILRAGRRESLTVALRPAPETVPRDERKIAGASPLTGASVANLSPAVADALGMAATATGVVVTDVEASSTAGQLGFQKKDVILAINGTKIADTRTLVRVLDAGSGFWRVTIDRDGRQITSAFQG